MTKRSRGRVLWVLFEEVRLRNLGGGVFNSIVKPREVLIALSIGRKMAENTKWGEKILVSGNQGFGREEIHVLMPEGKGLIKGWAVLV